jgi:hypothetical protein
MVKVVLPPASATARIRIACREPVVEDVRGNSAIAGLLAAGSARYHDV